MKPVHHTITDEHGEIVDVCELCKYPYITPAEALANDKFVVISKGCGGVSYLAMASNSEQDAVDFAERMNEMTHPNSHTVYRVAHDTYPSSGSEFADAFVDLVRYVFCGVRQLDEQGLDYSEHAHALRDVLTFAEGYIAAHGHQLSDLVQDVTTERFVRN